MLEWKNEAQNDEKNEKMERRYSVHLFEDEEKERRERQRKRKQNGIPKERNRERERDERRKVTEAETC